MTFRHNYSFNEMLVFNISHENLGCILSSNIKYIHRVVALLLSTNSPSNAMVSNSDFKLFHYQILER